MIKSDSALLLPAAAAAALLLAPGAALDNGLAIVPPKGWRSWNQFGVCMLSFPLRSRRVAYLLLLLPLPLSCRRRLIDL